MVKQSEKIMIAATKCSRCDQPGKLFMDKDGILELRPHERCSCIQDTKENGWFKTDPAEKK